MPRRSTLADDSDGALAGVDATNHALTVQDEIHSNIHRGIFYSASATSTITGGADADFLIRVPAGGSAHIRFVGTVEHSMRAYLFEAPTTTADGAAVATLNRNRFSANVASTLVFAGPTVTADGTELVDFFMPGGNKNSPSGGGGSSFEEWIFPPGDYLARISNSVISPAADGYAGLVIDFYEPA